MKKDFSGYYLGLTSNYFRHFFNKHYNEKLESKRGQIGIHLSDIKKIGSSIANFDKVKYGNNKETLFFTKNYTHKTFEIIVQINPNNKVLWGKSFRIKRT